MNEFISVVLLSLEGAYLQVSVFVAAVLIILGLINFKHQGSLIQKIEKHKKYQVFFGAFLGLTPGCGGAIFMMPLFIRGKVTYGAVIATLTATIGDSAFLLISTKPLDYLYVSIVGFITAIIVGYTVDYFRIDDKVRSAKYKTKLEMGAQAKPLEGKHPHIGHEEGDSIHHQLHKNEESDDKSHWLKDMLYYFYWALAGIGLVLGVMLLFQIDVNALFIPYLGTIVGVLGTLLSIAIVLMRKQLFFDDDHAEEEEKLTSLRKTFYHYANETAFVTSWVLVAYLIYELGVLAIGGGDYALGATVLSGWMNAYGLYTVLLGAIIGLIPGCGVQIVYMALYVQGVVPFSGLIANAISQDGDALLPLLAMDKKAS